MAIIGGAPRYSLIVETLDKKKYYFDTNLGVLVLMHNNEAKKSSLQAIDYLTSNFSDKNDFANSYGIDTPIARVYITYQFKGEKFLAPVFNNLTWSHVASTCNGSEIDFNDEKNRLIFNEVYSEISNLDSDFSNFLIKNKNGLVNLSLKTVNTIIGLRAHENAIKMKKTYGFTKDFSTFQKIDSLYNEDKYGYYTDLKKYLSKYREFRTVYLNYCKYVDKKEKDLVIEKPKKKVLVPPQQISFFDYDWGKNNGKE